MNERLKEQLFAHPDEREEGGVHEERRMVRDGWKEGRGTVWDWAPAEVTGGLRDSPMRQAVRGAAHRATDRPHAPDCTEYGPDRRRDIT